VPLCPANIDSQRSSAPSSNLRSSTIRLMIGFNDSLKSALLTRLDDGSIDGGYMPGVFDKQTEVASYLKKIQGNSIRAPQLYTYTSVNGSGVEPSDSGAPVLYGKIKYDPSKITKPRPKNVSNSDIVALNGKPLSTEYTDPALIKNPWILESIDCVTGVVTREFWNDSLKVNYENVGTNWGTEIKFDIRKLGYSVTALIQEVSNVAYWR